MRAALYRHILRRDHGEKSLEEADLHLLLSYVMAKNVEPARGQND